ncbi:dCTP deaminase domain-containing protein [Antarcticirhabdus aurantiaca]|uniref:Uncharacterized protein n=1 Tax=Antarcticirhabdus aurantiaca TaxID=2606717 RepID=A0ACD4NNJ6_9HYPH|nr:hypothetical protein [Antarcticirhabdus aurantiaca]WAJ28510.1 hypothetical protein OXU80_27515 [Jeongeuplla avenae]
MLNSVQINARKLVLGGVDASFRAISYDLRVGKVVRPGGQLADHYVIPPQGIVEIVSEERLALPMDVAGIAMVKTSLSNQGLLALNIGIVDPGYKGKIGSFFVNFGRREQTLRKGDVFLRVVFHAVAQDAELEEPRPVDDDRYLADKRINMEANFGTEFLNIADITERFAKEQFEKYRTKILGLVASAAFILAALTFMLNFGNLLLVQRFLQPNDATRAELLRQALDRSNGDLAEENRALLERVQQLDRNLSSAIDRLEGTGGRIDQSEGGPLARPPQGQARP